MSEKITGERNSYARELRGRKEGLDEELEIGSELLECVTGGQIIFPHSLHISTVHFVLQYILHSHILQTTSAKSAVPLISSPAFNPTGKKRSS